MGTVVSTIKRFIPLFIVSCLGLSIWSMCSNRGQGQEGAALVVGSRKVSGAELKERISEFVAGLELSEEEWATMKEALLRRAIDEYLVLEYGREAGIGVTELELDGEIRQVTADYGEGDFKEVLLRQHVGFQEWKNRLREQMLIRKIFGQVTDSIPPSSYDEIKTYYHDHQVEFASPAMIKFRQVVTVTAEEAETVAARLKAGGRFPDLALQHSTAPEAANGGEVGWVAAGQLEESMEKAIFALKVGETSPVVKTPYGYHVFQLVAMRPGGSRPIPEVMTVIETMLSDRKRERAWLDWLSGQRKRFPVSVRSEVFDKMEMS